MGKWPTSLLQPVINLYSSHCIKNFFTFDETMQQLHLELQAIFLCLFLSTLLAEMIQSCADTLYNSELTQPTIPKIPFNKLQTAATMLVEFSFKNAMNKRIASVAMGFPTGPALANIFIGYCEKKLLRRASKLVSYFRYVDGNLSSSMRSLTVTDFFRH